MWSISRVCAEISPLRVISNVCEISRIQVSVLVAMCLYCGAWSIGFNLLKTPRCNLSVILSIKLYFLCTFYADRKARLSERNVSLLTNCRARVLYSKYQNSCQRVRASLLAHATSAAEFRKTKNSAHMVAFLTENVADVFGVSGIKWNLIGNTCSNRSRVTRVANNKYCQLVNKNYAQTFASRKLGCTRHSINKFILCTR